MWKYSPAPREISNTRSQVVSVNFDPKQKISPSHVSKLNLEAGGQGVLHKESHPALLLDARISAVIKLISQRFAQCLLGVRRRAGQGRTPATRHGP